MIKKLKSLMDAGGKSGLCALGLSLVLFGQDGMQNSTFAQEQATEVEEKSADKESENAEPAEESEFDLDVHIQSFEKVWKTIDNVHWDPEVVGQKWDDARMKYRPQIDEAKSISDVREILTNMINELGQSHFAIIPTDAYDDVVGGEGGNADAGLTFRATDDGILVTDIRPGSTAEKAGIKTGWQLDKIRDKEVGTISEKLHEAAHGPMRYETLAGLSFTRMASGNAGDSVDLVLRDEDGATKEMKLELESTPGVVAHFGNLPPIYVTHKTKSLDGNVGYFSFSAFFAPMQVMPAFRKALQDENHANGIIIDVRGNIGGIGAMTMGMANMFAKESGELGIMKTKGGDMKFAVTPNMDPISCPVAVLVDECSISSAEILSGGLQDLKLAKVFGQRTAGLALPSTVELLPNGDGFQYAVADYHSASGKTLEMDGVSPDSEVDLSRELLLRDSDPVLSKALEWIKEENAKRGK